MVLADMTDLNAKMPYWLSYARVVPPSSILLLGTELKGVLRLNFDLYSLLAQKRCAREAGSQNECNSLPKARVWLLFAMVAIRLR